MPCRRYVIYVAWNDKKYKLGMSANPQIDLSFLNHNEGYDHIAYISSPLPLAVSDYVLSTISKPQERIGKDYSSGLKLPLVSSPARSVKRIIDAKFKQVKKELEQLKEECFLEKPLHFSSKSISIDYFSLHRYEDALEDILAGRIYYRREIERRLKERGIELDNLDVLLHLSTLRGQVQQVPSIKIAEPDRMVCNRCGHHERIKKAYCNVGKRECYFCEGCLMLGESKPCEALYAAPARPRMQENYVKSVRLNLDIAFSLPQYEAFEALARFVRKDSLSEAMVWAASGAARPEVAYGAIREVLKRGGRVLFGIPRKEIMEEMNYRLTQAFPGVTVAGVRGKVTKAVKDPDIVLASAYHALKYYRNFDLVILDEAEAFPFRACDMLVNALRRARKTDGKYVYITSTPDPAMYARAQRGEVKVIMIPLRVHGIPLPVPKMIVEKDIQGERKIPDSLFGLVRETIEEDLAQLLVVVPDQGTSARIGAFLREKFMEMAYGDADRLLMSTGCQDEEQQRKVNSWVRGEFPILVTTNLTRRGDVAPNTNVIVVYADNPTFDEGALLQLAGRVGWSDSYPTGKVWFIASRMTRPIEGAIRKINLLNEEAEKKGLLETGAVKRSDLKS
ncbi:MAG TPA: hypothetical protein GXX39_08795 [Syntrophothermus lipocalidus]|uniref:DEAD/DEAH box helicase n=1 Tax=Syntrophothermus sp. TaxID=2736299 RepID=UPI0017E155CA|nr:hypothetical protein [Syntrophothermus sp.]NSW83224.1 hypothetical protein [Syntrophothermus sp.]HHV77452.1 hypothetical protein [Syntrophothermus lipocalidus]